MHALSATFVACLCLLMSISCCPPPAVLHCLPKKQTHQVQLLLIFRFFGLVDLNLAFSQKSRLAWSNYCCLPPPVLHCLPKKQTRQVQLLLIY
jgi:hypothetical protein